MTAADSAAPPFGIEEEFLLTDMQSGAVREDAELIRSVAKDAGSAEVDLELRTAMLEIGTAVCPDLTAARADLNRKRRALTRAAAAAGADVLATAAHPLAPPEVVGYASESRYQRMAEAFGLIADEALVCGCHVHVQVESRAVAVDVMDRIRPWLAPLIALSGNSAFWERRDTGYDSWRYQVWSRWPTAGPVSIFGSVGRYEQTAEALVHSGAALDRGMLYFDVRPSEHWPTVEVRVADVCLGVDDALLIAALTRALVMTATANLDSPPSDAPVEVLRAAAFAASRAGLRDGLVDPVLWRLDRADRVLDRLTKYVADALEATGDTEFVADGIARVLRAGNGASQQRHAFEARGPQAILDLVKLAD
jgi:carboxylate-amine ligase